jgi:hypothetical protein
VDPKAERLGLKAGAQKLVLLLVRRWRPDLLVEAGRVLGWKVVYRRAFPRRPGFTRGEAERELATRRGIMLGRAVWCRGFNGVPHENWRAGLLVPES